MIVTGKSEVLGGKLPSPPTSHLQLLILVHLPDLSPDVGKDVMWVDFRLPMGQAAFFIPVVSCSIQRLRINMAIYFLWPRLSPQHAALPGLPRYLFASIVGSYVQYPAFYKYGTSLRSYGCQMAWNAGIAGRESVQSPPLFQGKMGPITFPCPRQ